MEDYKETVERTLNDLRRAEKYCLNDYSRMAGNAANIIENILTENGALRRMIDNLTSAQAVMVKEFTEKLEELAQAEKDGRLVVLPCKVGDTVWYITPSTEICEAQVIGIWLNVYTNPQMWLEIKYYSKFTGECEHKSRIDLMLDKTVFLTREDAEAALKGGEG